MRMKKFLVTIMAGVLVFGMSITASAATWEDVDSYEELSNAFADTDAEVHVVLTGNIVNEDWEELKTNQGQKYTIDGKEYVLTDICLNGAGDVVINANLAGDNEAGISTSGTVNVTVNGNVYGGTGADGVYATDDTLVTVNGDVYGGDGQAPDADGNLEHKTMNDPDGYSDGGAGVNVDKNAQVTVNGNVYGGDSYGTYGYAGAGIYAEDFAKVVVSGNSVGGNQIANPEVVLVDETNGIAGDGICAENTTDITVGKDAIGGTASGQESEAGSGIYLILSPNTAISTEAGEPIYSPIVPGQITVKGKVVAGTATADNGMSGVAVFYAIYDENPVEKYLLSDEEIALICDATDSNDADDIRQSVTQTLPVRMLYDAGVPYVKHVERLQYVEAYKQAVTELAATYGVDTGTITEFKDIVAAVPEENLSAFAKEACGIYNDLVEDIALTIWAVPVLTVGEMVAAEGSTQSGTPTGELESYFNDTYIIITGIEDDSKTDESEDDSKTDESEPGNNNDINNNDEGNIDSNPTESPKTGDAMNIAYIHMMLVVIAMMLLTFGVVFGRNKYIK